MNVVFCDTETTGLDPDRHEIWEVGLILGEVEMSWQLTVDLARADAAALKVGDFHERYSREKAIPPQAFVREFAAHTRGVHLAGAVISFDEERLRKLLRTNGECPMWHYHLVDVEALAAGYLGLQPPWDSNELSERVGVDPEKFERHSALGDARWAQAIYESVMARS